MKTKFIIFIFVVFFGAVAPVLSEGVANKLEGGLRNAIENILSPNGKYTIFLKDTVGIADAKTGEKLCEITDGFGNAFLTAFWSKDSKKLVVIEHYARASTIFIVQNENEKWKSSMLKESQNLSDFYKKINADRIGSEEYKFAGWVSDNEFKIHGVAINVQLTSGESVKGIPFEFNVKIADGKIDVSDVRQLQN